MTKYKHPLILGSAGMLGTAFKEALQGTEYLAWDREQDISAPSIIEAIKEAQPDILINCAAYTDVDKCETDKACFAINGQALEYLSQAALALDIPLVHFSTDYVFDGSKQTGYLESDSTNPVNEYGATKQVGEQFIQVLKPKYYLIRSSWLYGKGGKNFIDTIADLAKDREVLKVVDDQHGSPTWTKDLAEHTLKLLDSDAEFGIYHFSADGQTTWYAIAQEVIKKKGLGCKVEPQTTKELARPAKRPEYSVLLNTKFSKMRNWHEMIEEYLK